jgi:hypothetical protein
LGGTIFQPASVYDIQIFNGFLFFFAFAGFLSAQGLTPKSPQVVRSVERAAEYLKQNGVRESRLGGRALISMALVKAGVDETHPFIQDTIRDIRKAVATDGTVTIDNHIYTAGIIILFLGELDIDRHRRELDAFCRFLHNNQRKDGAWTYLTSGTADNYPSGDMSMTQYAVMALWTLHQLGFEVSGESVNRVGRWLVTIQNPEGGFAYQSTISPDFKQISWSGVRLSMTAAGMASVYVCRDLFGFNGNESRKIPEDEIHEAFKETPEFENGFRAIGEFRFSIPKGAFNGIQMKGNVWLDKHFLPITAQTEYFFYYLYALERYAAFRELAEDKHFESPPWYDKTATFLLANQSENGSWSGNIGPEVDTAYAVLFLLRSTHRTFEKIKIPNRYGGGNLLGGRGLPKLTDSIKIEEGQIVSLSEIGNTGHLMDNLANLEETDEKILAQLAELSANDIEDLLQKNKSKIRKLVGHEQAERRFAAVTMFGKSGDVSNAPILIYALSDPDSGVAQAAQDALLRLARMLGEEKLPDDPRKREQNIERWKSWYRKINPDVVFEER